MTIGLDIKEVLREVGNTITIIRDSGNITGEYTMFQSNAQVTKPFIREFFLEGWLSYDTEAIVGDIVEFVVMGDRYIVMNKSPKMLENVVYQYDGVFYKTNVNCSIYRPVEDEWEEGDYHRVTTWTLVKANTDVLITSPLYGSDLDKDSQIGKLGIETHEMYVPTSIGVQPLDRIFVSTHVFYEVKTVKPRRYDGVDVLEIGEDTRTMNSTTTTTSTSTTSTSSSTTTTTG
jgi:hypothetical protein